ncbi:MAG: hypothetical protein ACRCUS_09390, partial [Anaerovoracaceae bacterium]
IVRILARIYFFTTVFFLLLFALVKFEIEFGFFEILFHPAFVEFQIIVGIIILLGLLYDSYLEKNKKAKSLLIFCAMSVVFWVFFLYWLIGCA